MAPSILVSEVTTRLATKSRESHAASRRLVRPSRGKGYTSLQLSRDVGVKADSCISFERVFPHPWNLLMTHCAGSQSLNLWVLRFRGLMHCVTEGNPADSDTSTLERQTRIHRQGAYDQRNRPAALQPAWTWCCAQPLRR